MNVRARMVAAIVLGSCIGSAAVRAAPVEPPPAASDLTAPPAAAPTLTAPAPEVAPAATLAPVKIESPSTTIKFGVLAQPQYEGAGSVAADGFANNLFLRRARILVGGTLFGLFDYFLDTDFPNLFKTTAVAPPATSVKPTPGMNIQDVFLTYKPMADLLKVDVGYMLPPLAHNAVQGAGTLYGLDYFAFSFLQSGVFNTSASPVGRDVGVQARGLVLDGKLEYRAGLFQGKRNDPTATEVGARNFFRFAARVQVNLFDPEPGFFYAGTYFGAKKIVSVGASLDVQGGYRYFAGDVFADLPIGPGVFTGQLNLTHLNGGTFIPAATPLPGQTALMAEAGFNFKAFQVSPIVRFEHRWVDGPPPAGASETRFSLGAAYWPYLHNSNLKLFYTRLSTEGALHGANQINLQWQVYFF